MDVGAWVLVPHHNEASSPAGGLWGRSYHQGRWGHLWGIYCPYMLSQCHASQATGPQNWFHRLLCPRLTRSPTLHGWQSPILEVHICAHTHTHTMRAYAYMHTHKHKHTCIHTYTHAHMHTHIYLHAQTYTYKTHIRTCTHIHNCTHVRTKLREWGGEQ